MLSLFKKIFSAKTADLRELIKAGALIVDVRTEAEFADAHVKNSLNIPLEKIGSKAEELKQHSYIIVCCRSGNRSGMAERILKSKGLRNVSNGGSWQNVNNYTR